LEQRDALAEPRFRHAERARRGRETAVLDDGGEEAEVVEVGERAFREGHDCSPRRTIYPIIADLSGDRPRLSLSARRTTPARKPELHHETPPYRFQRPRRPLGLPRALGRDRQRLEAARAGS